MTLRMLACCLAALVLPWGLGACGGDESAQSSAPAETAGPPVDGDWLISRLPNEPAHLNRIVLNDAAADRLAKLVQESMLKRNNETMELEPHIAKSWEISEDKLTYTFHLRDDVKFSDGVPFTAEDVKFTFDKIMDPTVDAGPLRNYFIMVNSCEVVDPYTVKFACSEPYFKMLVVLGEDLVIVPKHIYETGDFNKHPNNRHPIGTGPYKFESWDTGSQIVFARNDDYWAEKPRLLKRVYKIITDDNAAFQVFERGDIDTMGLTPDQWVTRTNSPQFEAKYAKLKYYTPFHSYIGWNIRKPQLSDARVRNALTRLLDREAILQSIYHGLGQVVSQSVFYESPEYNHELKPIPYDPEQAVKLLDEAGWIDADRNGVREKDGLELRLELLIVADPTAEAIATVFKEHCAKAGIDMSIRRLEWATFMESIRNRSFDACMLGWQMDPENDPYQIWHSSQTEGFGSNHCGFVSAEVDRLLEEGRREFDDEKRVAMYNRINEIIHEQQPYTFLFCPPALQVLDKRFQNVKVYPLGPDAKEWWVPNALQRY